MTALVASFTARVGGYVMRCGPVYIDGADPNGVLVLSNGDRVGVDKFATADWTALENKMLYGVAGEGQANLSRFFNEVPTPKVAGAFAALGKPRLSHCT